MPPTVIRPGLGACNRPCNNNNIFLALTLVGGMLFGMSGLLLLVFFIYLQPCHVIHIRSYMLSLAFVFFVVAQYFI